VLVAALAWSTAGLFTRIVATDIPTTLFWRSAFGGVCVLLIYVGIKRSRNFRHLTRFKFGELIIALLSASGMICFISDFFHADRQCVAHLRCDANGNHVDRMVGAS